jgi:hypothetical protein
LAKNGSRGTVRTRMRTTRGRPTIHMEAALDGIGVQPPRVALVDIGLPA